MAGVEARHQINTCRHLLNSMVGPLRPFEARYMKGKAEGRAKGLAEGEAKGKVEGKIEIAKTMLGLGLQVATIVEYTGLSVGDIERLKEESLTPPEKY